MSSEPPALAVAGQQASQSRPAARHCRTLTAVLACCAAVIALAACGSGHPAVSPATSKTCDQVRAVLSDGPAPVAGKVVHAETQILPLRQIHGATPALRSAITELADAYSRFFASGGKSSAATSAVAAAAARMNKLCPGAGAAA